MDGSCVCKSKIFLEEKEIACRFLHSWECNMEMSRSKEVGLDIYYDFIEFMWFYFAYCHSKRKSDRNLLSCWHFAMRSEIQSGIEKSFRAFDHLTWRKQQEILFGTSCDHKYLFGMYCARNKHTWSDFLKFEVMSWCAFETERIGYFWPIVFLDGIFLTVNGGDMGSTVVEECRLKTDPGIVPNAALLSLLERLFVRHRVICIKSISQMLFVLYYQLTFFNVPFMFDAHFGGRGLFMVCAPLEMLRNSSLNTESLLWHSFVVILITFTWFQSPQAHG